MDHPFRTAAVGGFNRQDVLTYLENVTREAAERQQELQQQLDQIVEEKSQREQELAELRKQCADQTDELAELRQKLANTEQELTASRTHGSSTDSELASARREADELRRKVAVLQPGAEAYDAVKERTAGMELEAHHRAELVREEAREQAAQLRAKTQEWMAQVEREYDALRAQVESTVSHAADQLNRVGKDLNAITAMLEERDVALESLSKDYQEQTAKQN